MYPRDIKKSEKKWKKWKMWKTGKSEKHEKELHSQGPLVAFIQNVHSFTQLDTSGHHETWSIIDSSGHWWTKIDTSEDE